MSDTSWDVEVFFDGDCPLCMREISMLQRRDKRNNIRFTDIADAGFRPEAYGKTLDDFMQRIQGRLPDGAWIDGVEVFRRLYSAIGLGWLMPVSRLPLISQLLDAGYNVFAKNRLKWTGRCKEGVCKV